MLSTRFWQPFQSLLVNFSISETRKLRTVLLGSVTWILDKMWFFFMSFMDRKPAGMPRRQRMLLEWPQPRARLQQTGLFAGLKPTF